MKEYVVHMTVSVSVTLAADNQKQARAIAAGTTLNDVSEYGREVELVEDITPQPLSYRKGRGSY